MIGTHKTDTNIGNHCQCENPYLVARTNEISAMKTQKKTSKKPRKRDIILIKYKHLWENVKSVEPVYNELGLHGTSPIASDILWYQLPQLFCGTNCVRYSVVPIASDILWYQLRQIFCGTNCVTFCGTNCVRYSVVPTA